MFCSTAGAEETSLKVYPLSSPHPAPIIEAVRTMIGEDAKIVHDKNTNRLLVLATSNQQSQVSAILEKLDAPSRNIRIDVAIAESRTGGGSQFGVGGSGEIVVTPGGTAHRGRLVPYLDHRSSVRDSSTRQTLYVQNGGKASLRVGQEVPFLEWLVESGRHWGYIRQNVTMKQVGASLVVEPQIVGNGPMISVALVPELSGFVDGQRQSIRYTRAATSVTVKDGQPFSISGFGENSEFYSRFLAGVGRERHQKNMSMTLTARIVNPTVRAPMP